MGSSISAMQSHGAPRAYRSNSRMITSNVISISDGIVNGVTINGDFAQWTTTVTNNKTSDKYAMSSPQTNGSSSTCNGDANHNSCEEDCCNDVLDSLVEMSDTSLCVSSTTEGVVKAPQGFPFQRTTLGLRDQRKVFDIFNNSTDTNDFHDAHKNKNTDPFLPLMSVNAPFTPARLFLSMRSRKESAELDSLALGEMSISRVLTVNTAPIASLFGDRVMYGLPINYTLTTCGGQNGPIRSLACNGDGSQFTVVVVGNKQCFVVFGDGKVTAVIKGHYDPILCCAQSPDSKFLVTTSADCTAILWDINNGKRLRELPVNFQANVCIVSYCSDLLATISTEDVVQVWDAKSCEPIYTFTQHTGPIYALAFSKRGDLLASGGANGELFIWHNTTGDIRRSFTKHKLPVLSVSFSSDGKRLCSIDREHLKMWDIYTGQCVFTRNSRGVITMGPEHPIGSDDTHVNDEMALPGREGVVECLRFLSVSIIACNLVVVSLSSKLLLILEPNCGQEVLTIHTKAIITAFNASYSGDIVVLGDMHGNQYRLKLLFSPRDIRLFNLNSKAVSSEKVRIICD